MLLRFAFCLLFLVSTSAVASDLSSQTCLEKTRQFALRFLTLDGFPNVSLCEENEWRACLQIDKLSEQDTLTIYGGQYFYGGNYPNVNDYTFTTNSSCEIVNITVSRN